MKFKDLFEESWHDSEDYWENEDEPQLDPSWEGPKKRGCADCGDISTLVEATSPRPLLM